MWQKSKDSLKACFGNVNVVFCFLFNSFRYCQHEYMCVFIDLIHDRETVFHLCYRQHH